MGRNLLTSKERLDAWLHKQGYPGNQVKWAITPDSGKIPDDNWTIYNGDVLSLPTDIKISLQRVDGKSIIHLRLEAKVDNNGNPSRGANDNLMSPELTRIQRELCEKQIYLENRERSLMQREEDCRNREIDVMKSVAGAIQINSKLDDRTGVAVARLKEWEEHIVLMQNKHFDDAAFVDQVLSEKNALAEKNAVAASAVYVFDKLSYTYMFNKVKKFEDLTAEQIADFQQYVVDRAERRYFNNLPDAGLKLGESFTRLPSEHKRDFCKGVIKWAIQNDPNVILECHKEHVEETESRVE